jgi:hypothetical protein
MKKSSAILLAAAILASVATLAACDGDPSESSATGGGSGSGGTTASGGSSTTPPTSNIGAGAVNGHTLPFTWQGNSHTIVLGSNINTVLAALGTPGEDDTFRVESCAFPGYDYSYRFRGAQGTIEVTTFSPNGTDNHVLSVKITCDEVTTAEGARVNMTLDELLSRHGQPTEIGGTDDRYRYSRDGMTLEFLIRNGAVAEIFYEYDASAFRIDGQ